MGQRAEQEQRRQELERLGNVIKAFENMGVSISTVDDEGDDRLVVDIDDAERLIETLKYAKLPTIPVGASVRVTAIHHRDSFSRYPIGVVGTVVADEDTPDGLVSSRLGLVGWYEGRIVIENEWPIRRPWFIAVQVEVLGAASQG